MKNTYITPEAERIEFNYHNQVVAASSQCQSVWVNIGSVEDGRCIEGNEHLEYLK